MRELRRLVAFGCLLALAYGVYGLFIPVATDVRAVVPGISVAVPGTSSARVACGSVAEPIGFESGSVAAYVKDFSRVAAQDCPRALRAQLRHAEVWGGGALLALILALILLRSPAAPRPTRPLPVGGSGRSATWAAEEWTEDDRGSRLSDGSRGARWGTPRTVLLGLGVAGLVAYAGTRTNSSSEMSIGLGSGAATTASAARLCTQNALVSDSELFEKAQAASAADTENASLNLDGDPAYEQYSAALEEVDLTGCSPSFSSAFAAWVQDWSDYGSYELAASKPHAPWDRDWSSKNVRLRKSTLLAGLHKDYDSLTTAATSTGADVPPRSWPG